VSATDPTNQSGGEIPASLGSAAEELRNHVERQVREIVEGAERRAEEIEAAALRRARDSEANANRQARRTFVDAEQRATSLLASLDALEARIGSAIADMRRAGEALVGEIRRATPEPTTETSDPELREQLLAPAAPEQAPAAAPEAPAAGASGPPASAEMVREHLVKLRDEGRSRTQAARSLLEFSRDGSDYRAILDEVFPEEPEEQKRRGLLRRKRAPQPYSVEND
jgi:hypothetical protein